MKMFNISKLAFCALLLMISFSLPAMAQRGRGRSRGGGRNRGGILMQTINTDTNSKLDYYNDPKGARIIKASHFDLEYILGHKVMFLCEAKGDPRPHIIWLKDGIELYAHPYLQLHEWKIGDDVIKSKMEIDPATQMDAGLYECHANNKYSVDRRVFKADFSIDE